MPKLKETDKGHYYYIEELGRELPSVTTILNLLDDGKSGALQNWAVKMSAEYLKSLANPTGDIIIKKEEADSIFKKAKAQHKELKEQSAELGSAVHNVIECYLKNQSYQVLLDTDNRLVKPFEAFLEWQKQVGYEQTIKSEQIVWSELGFAGTLDIVARIKGKIYLVDLKTSNRIYDSHFMQISAYKEAYNEQYKDNILNTFIEEHPDAIQGLGVLRLGKEDGMPEWKEITTQQAVDYFECFMCLVSFYEAKGRIKRK